MGSPIAPSHLTLSDLNMLKKGESQSHSDFEVLYLICEQS